MKDYRVCIHQPDYFPWLGFFEKVRSCDHLILLNTAQYSRSGYTNRTKIKGSKGPIWLTQPVRRGRRSIEETFFATNEWREKHLKTLQMNYARSPNFEMVMNQVEFLLKNPTDSLDAFNSNIIKYLLIRMRIDVHISHAHCWDNGGLTGTERLIELCEWLRAPERNIIYVSGGGGRKYMDTGLFEKAGIPVEYNIFPEPVRPQLWGPFLPGLSCLDAMFNGACGGYYDGF